jgi:hypothetical protein
MRPFSFEPWRAPFCAGSYLETQLLSFLNCRTDLLLMAELVRCFATVRLALRLNLSLFPYRQGRLSNEWLMHINAYADSVHSSKPGKAHLPSEDIPQKESFVCWP